MSKQQELMEQLTDLGFQADLIIYQNLPVLVQTLHNTNPQGVDHSLTLRLQYRFDDPGDTTYFRLYGLTEIPVEKSQYGQTQMLCDFFNQRTQGGFVHISQDHTHVIYKAVLPELEEGQPELRTFFLANGTTSELRS